MKLNIFIGSPRGKGSNSLIMAQKVAEGFEQAGGEKTDFHFLNQIRKVDEMVKAFVSSDFSIIILPLYTDSVPGIVKYFIEQLPEKLSGKKLGFIIQSGFPESIQSEVAAMYLSNLAEELQADNLGVMIKGGVEGIQHMPERFSRKLKAQMFETGRILFEKQQFDANIKEKLARPKTLSPMRQRMFRFFMFTGLADMFWNSQLKKNKAYQDRYATPYH
jgi:NAD(P)H-dependent FMN reductase